MDLSKIKSQKIQNDPVGEIDTYENDQLGTLKIKRRFENMRDELIAALLDAKKKLQRARKINSKVKAVFDLIQKRQNTEKAKRKKSASLKEFIVVLTQPFEKATTDYYHLNDISKEDLEAFKEFADLVAPIITKRDKDLGDVVGTWQKTLDRMIEDYPNTFDDYAKEVLRQIIDTLYDYVEELNIEREKENVDLATSPFFKSELDIAIFNNNKGDYENM